MNIILMFLSLLRRLKLILKNIFLVEHVPWTTAVVLLFWTSTPSSRHRQILDPTLLSFLLYLAARSGVTLV